ncbi:AP2 domain-containing protein [Burkholderia multivorans]|uniref:AP2 domain-containing protein n=1 Tax=Burkholderia multivorans TaxID=87883 RepID=UPI0015903F70|nr:AP2 domain-containing protein [Burkholderia multivorans]MCA8339501.1 hypothetical protein [Burkholderia multivorans]
MNTAPIEFLREALSYDPESGVSSHPNTSRWVARIQHGGKQHYLGMFDTPELAHAAYVAAAKRLHGEFANAG